MHICMAFGRKLLGHYCIFVFDIKDKLLDRNEKINSIDLSKIKLIL